MSRPRGTLIAAACLLAASSLSAHHNMSAVFDFNDRVSLSGTLTKVDWRNPHIYLFVDVKAPAAGQLETWSIEGPSPGFFRARDISSAEFQSAIGKTISAEASRARDGSKSGLIRTVKLPDGKVIELCPQNC
jgi:Family of unknown function (DUF6152)